MRQKAKPEARLVFGLSEVADILGFSADGLRKKELEGRLPPAPRDLNGYRKLSADDIETWRAILMTPPRAPRVLTGVAAANKTRPTAKRAAR